VRTGGRLAIAVVLLSARAHAEEVGPVCEDPRVRIEGHPAESWPDAIARACTELADMPDSDPTSRVRLLPSGRDLIVEVTLEDGRTAVRRVRDPAKLKTTLDALLTLPPASRRIEAPVAPPSVSSPSSVPSDEERASEPAHASPAPRLAFEAGIAVGGRVAGAQAYLSVAPSGYAELRIDEWLIGIGARWDVFQTKSDVGLRHFEMDTVGADLFAARRFRADGWSADLGLSSRLLVETQSFHPERGKEDTDAQSDMRLGPFLRVSVGRGSLRPIFVLDGEVSPSRVRRSIRVDEEFPVLPSWSLGLSAGVAWGRP
jgi:hypothetical protein